jgi:oxygen-independent coproporphyrinogen-3 oxidase
VRYSTILSPQRYIKLLQEDVKSFEFPYSPATDQATVVDLPTEITDTLLMGLRLTQEGINRQAFRKRFGVDLADYHQPLIERFVKQGLLYMDEQVVRVTQKGRLLSNLIFRELV